MKILFQINVVANWGSTGRIAEEIGEMAISKGWKSYIAFGRNMNSSSSTLIRVGSQFGIMLHVLKSRLFDKHGLGSTKATIDLVKKIEEIKPDIIHLHNIHGYYLNYCVLFEYLSQCHIPVVWTLHDCWAFTGHCSHYDVIKCKKWMTLCEKCPQLKSYPASFGVDCSKTNYKLKRELFNNIPNLILVPVSQWLSDNVKESFLKNCAVKLIHNGVSLDNFKVVTSQKQDYISKDKFMILGVASIWTDRKGLNDFLELSEILPDDYMIVLLGLTQKQIHCLPTNVIGITRTESVHKLTELYSSADLFLNLTKQDNFPTTNLEALASGTPVITYRTGGSVEAVDEKTGLIVEQGDIKGVFNAIKQIRAKGKSYYSDACRERAIMNFNKVDRYNEYIQLYDSILNKL